MLGAGLALAGPAAAADQPIAFADYAYSPRTASINGRRHRDVQRRLRRHPLVWADGSVTNTGPSKTFTFQHPGTYAYYCQVHVDSHDMRGSITVVDQHPASVSFGVSPSPRAGQPVTFTYTGSADPDGTLTSWKWDLDGDGAVRDDHAHGRRDHDLRDARARSPSACTPSTTAARPRPPPSRP